MYSGEVGLWILLTETAVLIHEEKRHYGRDQGEEKPSSRTQTAGGLSHPLSIRSQAVKHTHLPAPSHNERRWPPQVKSIERSPPPGPSLPVSSVFLGPGA